MILMHLWCNIYLHKSESAEFQDRVEMGCFHMKKAVLAVGSVCLLVFVLWIYGEFEDESYTSTYTTISQPVTMDATNVESIIAEVQNALSEELENYYLTELYLELKEEQGVDYIRLSFMTDAKEACVDAKIVEAYPNEGMIAQMEHFVGTGRAYSGFDSPLGEEKLDALYEQIHEKLHSDFTSAQYEDKVITVYLSNVRFAVEISDKVAEFFAKPCRQLQEIENGNYSGLEERIQQQLQNRFSSPGSDLKWIYEDINQDGMDDLILYEIRGERQPIVGIFTIRDQDVIAVLWDVIDVTTYYERCENGLLFYDQYYGEYAGEWYELYQYDNEWNIQLIKGLEIYDVEDITAVQQSDVPDREGMHYRKFDVRDGQKEYEELSEEEWLKEFSVLFGTKYKGEILCGYSEAADIASETYMTSAVEVDVVQAFLQKQDIQGVYLLEQESRLIMEHRKGFAIYDYAANELKEIETEFGHTDWQVLQDTLYYIELNETDGNCLKWYDMQSDKARILDIGEYVPLQFHVREDGAVGIWADGCDGKVYCFWKEQQLSYVSDEDIYTSWTNLYDYTEQGILLEREYQTSSIQGTQIYQIAEDGTITSVTEFNCEVEESIYNPNIDIRYPRLTGLEDAEKEE